MPEPDDRNSLAMQAFRALDALQEGDSTTARSMLDDVEAADPEHRAMLQVRSRDRLTSGDIEGALHDAERAVSADPDFDGTLSYALYAQALRAHALRTASAPEAQRLHRAADDALYRGLAGEVEASDDLRAEVRALLRIDPQAALATMRRFRELDPDLVSTEDLIELFGEGGPTPDALLDTWSERTGRSPAVREVRAAQDHQALGAMTFPAATLLGTALVASLMLRAWGDAWPRPVIATIGAAVLLLTALATSAAVPARGTPARTALVRAVRSPTVIAAGLAWLAGLASVVAAAVGASEEAGARMTIACLTGGASVVLLRWRTHRDLRLLRVTTGPFLPDGLFTLIAVVGAVLTPLLILMAADPTPATPGGAPSQTETVVVAAVAGVLTLSAAATRWARHRAHRRNR